MGFIYFIEKNVFTIFVAVLILAFGICAWAYLDFLRDMRDITNFSSQSLQTAPGISQDILDRLATSGKEGAVPADAIKMISSSQSKVRKPSNISADILQSISTKK